MPGRWRDSTPGASVIAGFAVQIRIISASSGSSDSLRIIASIIPAEIGRFSPHIPCILIFASVFFIFLASRR